MSIQLIADSCCDTTPKIKESLGLLIAPLKINVGGGKTHVDDGTIDIPSLLAEMNAAKQAAGSACPSPEEFARLMRPCDECVVITLSDKLSGSYNAARVAREMVLEEDPAKKIHIFNSKSAAAGELRIALFVRERIDAGDNFETLVLRTEAYIARQRTLFVLEDLGNLVKNGRLNKVSGIVASILSLCPIMSDDGQGEVKMALKVRGLQNALSRLVDLVAEQTAPRRKKSVTLVLVYCNCPDRAAKLKKAILEKCAAVREVILVPTGGVSTVYANNGGVVLAF